MPILRTLQNIHDNEPVDIWPQQIVAAAERHDFRIGRELNRLIAERKGEVIQEDE
jgi:hypothetical protein